MKRTKMMQSLAILIFPASLLTLTIVDMPSYARGIAAILAAASGYALYVLERRRLQSTHNERLVRTVNHYRHDWMNDFQVLLGLAKLKKYDSMQSYMDKIKVRMHQESCMSKLGCSSLVAYFMSFRTERQPLELEIGLEQEIKLKELSVDNNQLVAMLRSTVEYFCRCVQESDGEPNLLSIEFGMEAQDLIVDCMYTGNYCPDKLHEAVGELKRKYGSLAEIKEEQSEDSVVLTYRFSDAAAASKQEAAGYNM